MLVCGVDEAGRGSMLGPLVIAGVLIEKSKIPELEKIGVKDSKKLSPKMRQELYKKILRIVDDYKIFKATPRQIDLAVNQHKLNYLESMNMAKVISHLKPSLSYVDSCDVNATRFGNEINKMTRRKIKSYHHADSKFIVVSAASIIAKVTRDNAIATINKKYPVGSGYPSDPTTVSFVKSWFSEHGKLPECVRKSWAPSKLIMSQTLT